MTTTNNFSVGQKVTFTNVRTVGRTINFRSCDGVVHEMNGNEAVVKSRSGMHTVPLADLRAKGERNALTDAVLGGLDIERDADNGM